MNKPIADGIITVANASDLNLEIHEEYSGRGMYGRQTTGIVGDFGDLLAAVAIYAADLESAESNTNNEDGITVEDLSLELKKLRYDNMACQMIFY